jgi:hypothetical protein
MLPLFGMTSRGASLMAHVALPNCNGPHFHYQDKNAGLGVITRQSGAFSSNDLKLPRAASQAESTCTTKQLACHTHT